MVHLITRNGSFEVIPEAERELFYNFSSKQEAVDKLIDLGVEPLEVKFALEQLDERSHTKAHFGYRGTFIFSENE